MYSKIIIMLVLIFLQTQSLLMAYSLNIKYKNEIISLYLEQLHNIKSQQLTTLTSWTKGEPTFSGIYLRDLFEHLDIKSGQVQLLALNNYLINIDLPTLLSYDAFIATHQDGNALTIRKKGLYWIIFPRSQRPELSNQEIDGLSIWQLKDIFVLEA